MASESGHHDDVFHHIRDFPYFELSESLGVGVDLLNDKGEKVGFGIPLPEIFGFQITKFMILEVVAAAFVLVVFRGVAMRTAGGAPVRGRWWNFWEWLAVYMREQVTRPLLGGGHHDEHDAHGHGEAAIAHGGDHATHEDPVNRFTPFIWSCTFFILICNLLGMIPWLGSPTGNLWVTGALAATTFGYVLFAGMQAQGVVGFWKSLVPNIDLPPLLALFLVPMIWVIELFGLIVKHCVLAVRLFANMMGGHTVVFVMLTFIATAGGLLTPLGALVTPASVLGQAGISLLELLVAFIQAYVFAFLATIFLSMALHPH